MLVYMMLGSGMLNNVDEVNRESFKELFEVEHEFLEEFSVEGQFLQWFQGEPWGTFKRQNKTKVYSAD